MGACTFLKRTIRGNQWFLYLRPKSCNTGEFQLSANRVTNFVHAQQKAEPLVVGRVHTAKMYSHSGNSIAGRTNLPSIQKLFWLFTQTLLRTSAEQSLRKGTDTSVTEEIEIKGVNLISRKRSEKIDLHLCFGRVCIR